jgi:hypothetical protein
VNLIDGCSRLQLKTLFEIRIRFMSTISAHNAATADIKVTPIYVTGDTVWFDGVAEVVRRFRAGVVLPFVCAARTRGPFDLTMDTNRVAETARGFADAIIVPVHLDSWVHLPQHRDDLRATLQGAWNRRSTAIARTGHSDADRRMTVRVSPVSPALT